MIQWENTKPIVPPAFTYNFRTVDPENNTMDMTDKELKQIKQIHALLLALIDTMDDE